MNPALIVGALGAGLVVLLSQSSRPAQADPTHSGGKTMQPDLKHFEPWEFREWYRQMNPELLRKLDAFRDAWGYPVVISTAEGALGRHLGNGSDSQHNVDEWGQVNAVDVFPKLPAGRGGYRYLDSPADRDRAYRIARRVGFTGVGLYTDTTPGNMVHLDVRSGAHVATWSRIDGQYLDIGSVLA